MENNYKELERKQPNVQLLRNLLSFRKKYSIQIALCGVVNEKRSEKIHYNDGESEIFYMKDIFFCSRKFFFLVFICFINSLSVIDKMLLPFVSI